MSDCIFCKIISKEIPSEIIYEDENTLVFLDINPATKGHCLVIPKEHYETILDVPEDVLCKVIKTVKKISSALSKTNPGMSVVQSNGRAAHQEVDHIHFHVIPRSENDGQLLTWKAGSYAENESKSIANEIRSSITP
ncbi:HIT family protein [Candidatus Woesearchaeota archaeon]|jgi:histidine triad (HIT) family protein|nr:HIT family protein [Candidatus Woesearchaeota archaeon]MBT5215687.1 HIT family protein [Candidatus Woesearchaeota archaeon]